MKLAADSLEAAYGLVDPSTTREWMLVVRNCRPLPQQFEAGEVVASAVPVFRSPLESTSRTECEVCKRPLATHSAALAELATSGEVVSGGCPGCGLLPESFHTSTALVRARDTVERFAERMIRESDFSTASFRMFIKELCAAWHLEPSSLSHAKLQGSGFSGAVAAPGPRMLSAWRCCWHHVYMTRHWPQTIMYLNAF